MQPVPVNSLVALWIALWGYVQGTCAAAVPHKSNAIKSVPAGCAQPISAAPDLPLFDSGGVNVAVDSVQLQPASCSGDHECADDEFCYGSRGACAPCRKRKKRCIRDAVCCPGNYCSNGVCTPIDFDTTQGAGVDAALLDSFGHENSTLAPQSKQPPSGRPQSLKGQEGDLCLRSTDCSEGLCCARHFWSKICKPVLTEGQVCTKHKRKGTHNLELFQRCDCAEGLGCRTQKGDPSGSSSRSLHTCQRH